MKRIFNYWHEIACFSSFCYFLWTISAWMFAPPESSLGVFVFVFLGFADVLAFLYLLRWLWINKWKDKYRYVKEKIIAKAARFFARFFEKLMKKWSIGSKKKNVISGDMKIVFNDVLLKKEGRSPQKTPRYKHLKSDRERLRFLYRSMIVSKIHSGERIRSYDTPSELKIRVEHSENADKLFSMYIGSRYDDRTVLDGDEIQALKDSLSQEFTIR